uniref:RING-type E3 ubiquitin transferase n=1 Tax=Alexandrium monilatum TaxID=311494 RepID=A0A7S4SQQ0_9DINO
MASSGDTGADAAPAAAAAEDVVWQWLNPRGGWQDFRPRASQQLEAACRAGRAVCSVDTPAGRVAVNFQSRLQTQVSGGSAPRKVRRMAGGEEQRPTVDAGADGAGSSPSFQDPAPRGAAKAKAKVAASRPPRPVRGGSPAARGGGAAAARGSSPQGAPPAARASSQPAPRSRRSPGRAAAAVGGAAAGRPRGGAAHQRAFADDEALALWLSTQEGLSDEEVARICAEHYSRPRPPVQPARGDYLDVDNMSYEDLLALSERIGFVERSRPATSNVASLPTRRATSDDVQDENECAICCDVYAEGDELRILPCFHEFHKLCIDRWLLSGRAGARKCPMCNAEVEF